MESKAPHKIQILAKKFGKGFMFALLTAILLAIAGFFIYMFWTWPVYPDFQKEAANYENLQQKLSKIEELVYPDLTLLDGADISYRFLMSGRERTSKPFGYSIYGIGSMEDTEGRFSLTAGDIQSVRADGKSPLYRGIPLDLVEANSPKDSYWSTRAEFCPDDICYQVSISFRQEGLAEERIRQLSLLAREKLEYLTHQIIDLSLDQP